MMTRIHTTATFLFAVGCWYILMLFWGFTERGPPAQTFHHLPMSLNADEETKGSDSEVTGNDDVFHHNDSDFVWPDLDDLIVDQEEGVIGDTQFLLDFVIPATPKTGTTEMMWWLNEHPEIAMYNHELHILTKHRPGELVKKMYELETHNSSIKRGYKSPHELERNFFAKYYSKYWPRTKLVVGLRHPIKWFESNYNFATRMKGRDAMPPAESFVGDNFKHTVLYHEHLAKLGKTKLHQSELDLLGPVSGPFVYNDVQSRLPEHRRMKNPIFLYHVLQFFDKNETRSLRFRQDLQQFLGLKKPIAPYGYSRDEGDSPNHHYKIDICKPKYRELRSELLAVGVNSSKWISKYLMDEPDVFASDRDGRFTDLLELWNHDPCADSNVSQKQD